MIVTVIYMLVALVAIGAQPALGSRPGGGPVRDPRRCHRGLAGHAAGRRRGHLDLQRDLGHHLRPDPHPVRDVPRRPDSEMFHKVNPRTLTPVPNTIIVAVVICILAGFIPINFLAEMTSVGTLVAFVTVAMGVIILRRS